MTIPIDEAVKYSNSRAVVLADVVAGMICTAWTNLAAPYDMLWSTPVPGRVVAVMTRFGAIESDYYKVDDIEEMVGVAGSFCYLNGLLYICVSTTPGAANPFDRLVRAMVEFNVSNWAKDNAGVPYFSRLADFPELDVSIPARFTMQSSSRGGSLVLEQAEGATPTAAGAFDGLDLDWDAGYVTVRAGLDVVR